MTCYICQREIEAQGACQRCISGIVRNLTDIDGFYLAAHSELIPGSGGHGSSSGERTIGINVGALSFVAGDDILGLLHSWEVVTRQGRKLTAPALLAKKPVAEEVRDAIAFAIAHLPWMATQEWIGDFAKEVKALHELGRMAARDFVEKSKRIDCPADTQDGSRCGHTLKIAQGDTMEIVTCKLCGTEWTALRLIAVALSDTRREVLLDAEAIGGYLGILPRSVHLFAKRNKISKQGQRYNLNEFLAKRNVT